MPMHLFNLIGEDSHFVVARDAAEAVAYFRENLEDPDDDDEPPRVVCIDPSRWSDIRIRIEADGPGDEDTVTTAAAEIGDPSELRDAFCIGSTGG